ncbi:MAG: MBOAT family protein [Planctomycetes bacterium]|nr:MBOAT family protein [Planctomycetota bacterium]
MAFNSIEFLYFLLIAVGVHQLCRPSLRLPWLLACSYYFYAQWNHIYLWLIVLSTFIDYTCAIYIEKQKPWAKFWLGVSLCSNLGMLFFFKYYGFFSEIVLDLTTLLNRPFYTPILNVLLPVGISFYTFQTMSYSIDVYRGKIKAEKHFIKFAVYVASFPQLVAGPIERASHLLPQMDRIYRINTSDAVSGLRLIGWGLFKKVVVADRLSAYVEYVLSDHSQPHSIQVFLAGFWAIVVLYADFSGYADIAIGSARMVGLHLRDNFNFPYFSRSIQDFWKRWHMSLHSWFLDYVYFPLGGSRVPWSRLMMNIAIVFLLSGLWHGASWNFVIWAMLHAVFVVFHMHFMKVCKFFNIDFGEGFFVRLFGSLMVQAQWAFSMYFFFVDEVHRSLYLLKCLVTSPLSLEGVKLFPFPPFVVLLCFFATFCLYWGEWMHLRKAWPERLAQMSLGRRWACYYVIIFTIMIIGVETQNPFIYFQF